MAWTSRTREVLSWPVRWLGLASIKTLYDVLGVRRDADPETINQAFRRAVKAHHPDAGGGEAAASETFHDVIAASEILRDPERRAVYDRQLALERELAQLAFRDALVRATLTATAVALVVIGGSGAWIVLTGSPVETRSTHGGAEVATMSQPVPSPPASKTGDAPAASDLPSEPDPTSRQATRDAAIDSAGRDARIDSAVLDDSVAALPSAPPATSVPQQPIETSGEGGPDPDIAELDEALRRAPNDAQAHRRRGNLWGRKGDMERALADYDQAIRIDPGDIAIFHDRGVMWQRNGELDKALVDLDRAVRMSFADPEVYNDRGAVWFEKGSYDRALADFNQALKIAPGLASAFARRAAAFDRKGDQDRARADLEQASRLANAGRPDRGTDSAGAR